MATNETPNLLFALPLDALNHAVSFLDSKDALRLSELNSSFRDTLSLSALHNPTPLLIHNVWHGTHEEASNTPGRSVWIPAHFPRRTHSIVLTCKWRDQGFGTRKGALFVVAVDVHDDPNSTTLQSMDNGMIVCKSPLAPHEEESLRMSFSYSSSKAYYLWYRVGSGGGYGLYVNDLKCHTIIHDSPGKFIGRSYKVLNSRGFLQNNDISLRMLQLIATMGQEEMPQGIRVHLVAFLSIMGFDVSKGSMKALEEIATALLEHQHQDEVHAALATSHNENNVRAGELSLPPMPANPIAFTLMNHFDEDEAMMAEANGMMAEVHSASDAVFTDDEYDNEDSLMGENDDDNETEDDND